MTFVFYVGRGNRGWQPPRQLLSAVIASRCNTYTVRTNFLKTEGHG